MRVRAARPGDSGRLLKLMAALARFEEYDDAFAVTEESLLANGFGEAPLFRAFVAEDGQDLVGMAVTYVVPWTYTLRPRLVLKELFVDEAHRSSGAGRALFAAVVEEANRIGAADVAWTVMAGNAKAERFYSALGGRPDLKWNNWTLSLSRG